MSDLVGNPEDRFSHNEAQVFLELQSRAGCLKIDMVLCLLQYAMFSMKKAAEEIRCVFDDI